MSIAQPRYRLIGVLAAVANCLAAASAAGRESTASPDPTNVEFVEFLVPESELDRVNMSIVDDKLAMSLAVEIHIHMDVMEFALKSMNDKNVKALTERKLRVYRQLYNTLDSLTAGRVESMLARRQRRAARNAGDDDQSTGDEESVETRTASKRHGGGIGRVLQSTATKAILRVRLKIAEQYAALLRSELATAMPTDFDRQYMNVELYNQMQVLSMLRVFEEQASSEFAGIIHLAAAAAEDHMLEARQLVDQLRTQLPVAPPASPVVTASDTSSM